MSNFIDVAVSFPTVVFTFLLCVSTILWLLTALGFLGVDAPEGADVGDIGDIGDAGDVGDIGGDGGVGGTHAHTEVNTSTAQEAAGFMTRMGLNGIPVTILLSFISLFGWVQTYLIQKLILNHIPLKLFYYPAGAVVMIAVLYISTRIAARVCAPLRKSLIQSVARSKASFIGQTVTVLSSEVTENFGEARLDDDGATLLLKIRAEKSKGFKKGDRLVLLEYLSDQQVYTVISEEEFKGY